MALDSKLKNAFEGKGGRNPSLRIALEVQEFEVHTDNSAHSTVTGKRLDNGDTIQVYLRPDERKNPNPKYPRPEFADLMKSGKSHVEPGGVIQLDGAYYDPERKQYSARWCKTLLHNADKGAVFQGQARVSPMRTGKNGNEYKTVECLSSNAQTVTSEEELRSVMARNFEGRTGSPFNMIRIVADDGEAVSRIFYGRQKKSEQDGQTTYEPMSGQEMMAELDGNARFKEIVGQINDGGAFSDEAIRVEVVPGGQFRVGSDSCNEAFGKAFIRQSKDGEYEYSHFAHGIVALVRVGENKEGLVATSANTVHYQADFSPHGLGSAEAVEYAPRKQDAPENTGSTQDSEEAEIQKPAQTPPKQEAAKAQAAASASGSGFGL